MRALFVALLPLLLVACKTAADAPVVTTPIQAVLAQGKDDQRVVVRGQVLQKLSDERFVVGDSSGAIHVHIDDDAVRRAGIGVGSQVEVAGEVDTKLFRDPTIKAERVVVLAPRAGAAGRAY
ncbi:MAG TPA: NirD/YgiW/YdeI family stress tolerance protein [Burkholderiales bacterium]|nr:NirD/YgiW/YdeI family stress tolerance protein [Burkholderiales bacterium]